MFVHVYAQGLYSPLQVGINSSSSSSTFCLYFRVVVIFYQSNPTKVYLNREKINETMCSSMLDFFSQKNAAYDT